MEYVDRLLICADCNEGFVFSAGEQLFFSDRQFRNDPRRCKACRIKRMDQKGAARQGPSSRRTETRAICSQCEVETIIPFRPTTKRPVFCRQCFQAVQSSTVSPVGGLATQS
jgi:CxxC-x17-CxxC domain-containing protein